MSDAYLCQDCGAFIPGDELVFDMDAPDEAGDVVGQCPECDSTNVLSY